MNQTKEEVREGSFNNLIEVSRDLNIITDGPLSQMFTAVLNTVYKKEIDPHSGIAIESQALDAQTAENLWIASKLSRHTKDAGMLYGVYDHQASLQDLVAVTEALKEMTPEEKTSSAIVCVTHERDTSTGQRFKNYHFADPLAKATSALYANDNDFSVRHYRANNVFSRSLKALADAEGVKFYASLESYIEDHLPEE